VAKKSAFIFTTKASRKTPRPASEEGDETQLYIAIIAKNTVILPNIDVHSLSFVYKSFLTTPMLMTFFEKNIFFQNFLFPNQQIPQNPVPVKLFYRTLLLPTVRYYFYINQGYSSRPTGATAYPLYPPPAITACGSKLFLLKSRILTSRPPAATAYPLCTPNAAVSYGSTAGCPLERYHFYLNGDFLAQTSDFAVYADGCIAATRCTLILYRPNLPSKYKSVTAGFGRHASSKL